MNKNKLDFGISPEKIAGKNVLLATTVWNKELLLPARNEIKEKLESMSANILELFCPGSLELTASIKRFLNKNNVDGVIALGLVIKGDTPHFRLVSQQTFHDLARLSNENFEIPLVNGVLTVDNRVQAEERTNPAKLNKGAEFALSLMHMLSS